MLEDQEVRNPMGYMANARNVMVKTEGGKIYIIKFKDGINETKMEISDEEDFWELFREMAGLAAYLRTEGSGGVIERRDRTPSGEGSKPAPGSVPEMREGLGGDPSSGKEKQEGDVPKL